MLSHVDGDYWWRLLQAMGHAKIIVCAPTRSPSLGERMFIELFLAAPQGFEPR